ncbi:hypothetical protein [Geodermatophilus ruber]|uniref:Uncharacterized protein n=1 Tax=Geodermatophilus ruber TaxID=504800 RepID=A0A1I4EXR3_9ACTN|nr:hypothetical protein [Geodermatophilus ruber]SFL10515.1 hypothetical protein SAMN04488085_106247 [Geodermatophilus ruber]
MSTIHWARPDIAGDVLAIARDRHAAPPREIRIRPELHACMLAQLDPAARAAVERGTLGAPPGVPLVVDPELPAFPGFEVVRARPAGPRVHAA